MVVALSFRASLCLPAGAVATSSNVACNDGASHDNGALNSAIAAATSGDVVTVSEICLVNLTIANKLRSLSRAVVARRGIRVLPAHR